MTFETWNDAASIPHSWTWKSADAPWDHTIPIRSWRSTAPATSQRHTMAAMHT